ncbi:hypothetical protein KBD33_04175 [Candidatus Gracilibacteria bacterium]|nr:hypothetical protein [Candidatus Gracilibacteria bacterium]
MLNTLTNYIQVNRFTSLRKRLQKLRLTFFNEIQELSSRIEDDNLALTAGLLLDKISLKFPRIIKLIGEIESLEKRIDTYDLFDHNAHLIVITRDMLTILLQIKNNLTDKHNQILNLENNIQKSIISDELESHVRLLTINKKEIEQKLDESISKITIIINKLESFLEWFIQAANEVNEKPR